MAYSCIKVNDKLYPENNELVYSVNGLLYFKIYKFTEEAFLQILALPGVKLYQQISIR